MPIRDEERLTLWNRFFPLPLAANQVIKLPKGKYTEREKEMMTGVCSIPHHFFSATKKLTLTKPFLLGKRKRKRQLPLLSFMIRNSLTCILMEQWLLLLLPQQLRIRASRTKRSGLPNRTFKREKDEVLQKMLYRSYTDVTLLLMLLRICLAALR